MLANRVQGARIDIRPQTEPGVVVSLTHLRPDPSLTVGSPVAPARSNAGVVLAVHSPARQTARAPTPPPRTTPTPEPHAPATPPLRLA